MKSGHVTATPAELDCIRGILRQFVPGARVHVYGSRARGTLKRYADLDVAIDAGRVLDLETVAALREAFDESMLPYRVDVTDVRACDSGFLTAIAEGWVELA